MVASGVLTVAAIVLWAVSLPGVDATRVNGLGLLSVVGPVFLASFALLNLAFALSVTQASAARIMTGVQLLALIVMLNTVASIVEQEPAYFSAYLHAGFTNYVADHGAFLPFFDARFNWPGAFALGAFVIQAAGLHSAVDLIRWAPVFFELLYLVPLWVIVSAASDDDRVRWTAVWIFYLSNWLSQDYLSPQALNFFLFLCVMAAVLFWFRDRPVEADGGSPARGMGRLRDFLGGEGRLGARAVALSTRQRSGVLLVIVAISGTVVVAHQVTPVFLVLALGALLVGRRLSVPRLPLIVGVIFLAYLSFGATTFWRGHIEAMFGGFGQLGHNVNAGVGQRITGSGLHRVVLYARVALAGLTVLLAVIGLVVGRRDGRRPVLWAILAAAPFLLVSVQSYGGEAVLRSYLFALPFLSVLVAIGLSSLIERARPMAVVAMTLAGAVLTVGFIAARYGNDQFEQVAPSELHAVQWVYANAPHGSIWVAASRNLPWRYEGLTAYTYIPPDDSIISSADSVIRFMKTRHVPAYFISTDSQELFGQELYGLRPGWLHRLDAQLDRSGQVKVVFSEGDARVYALYGTQGGSCRDR